MCGRQSGQEEMVSTKWNEAIDKQPDGRPDTVVNDDSKDRNCSSLAVEESTDSSTAVPSPDPVKLIDLPLPPLLVICKYLRAEWYSNSLSNFRKTCRVAAYAVNVFLENQANLPDISNVYVYFWENTIKLVVSIFRFDYYMHPLSTFRDDINGQLYWRDRQAIVHISFDIQNDYELDQAFEQAAQYLRGPVNNLDLTFTDKATDKIDKLIKLVQNISFKRFEITGRLTSEVGSLTLELLRKQCQPVPEVFIASYFGVPSIFSPAFLTELDTLAKRVMIRSDRFNFPGLPNALWQQFLMQKLMQGSQVMYWTTQAHQFTVHSDVTLPRIRINEVLWH